MSREIITCENCEHIEYRLYDDDEYEECSYCGSALKTETVYTEEEFQEAIKAEREECLQDFVKKLSTGYTIKECVEAIRAKDK